ncbi:MAG: hydroxyacid dehydrogenase [Lachnospiraceae bacterium]|nr:hydroxyacid dehydrogenase [Lachnospiraceae bacterium]
MERKEKMERDKKIGSDEMIDRDETIERDETKESDERMEMDEKTGGSIGMKMDGRVEEVGKMEREVGRTMGIGKDEVFLKWGERRDEEWSEEWEERYWEVMGREGRKVVVLDDDPTGIQTVHGVFVYTDAGMESIRAGLLGEERVFFILTNSRALGEAETVRLHREIGRKVAAAAEELGVEFLLVSRGDSTLRGHYPAETESLREGLEGEGVRVDGEVICPFFEEGGRFTAGDVHYVEMGGGRLVPAGETEFAKDSSFGYVSSDLKDWVEEKSGGKVKREDVVSVSLEELREYRIGEVADKLMGVEHFGKVVVNAVSYEDLKVFVIALLEALGRGKYFLFRTAASFVKVLGGMEDRALLEGADLYGNVKSRFGGWWLWGLMCRRRQGSWRCSGKGKGFVFWNFRSRVSGMRKKWRRKRGGF